RAPRTDARQPSRPSHQSAHRRGDRVSIRRHRTPAGRRRAAPGLSAGRSSARTLFDPTRPQAETLMPRLGRETSALGAPSWILLGLLLGLAPAIDLPTAKGQTTRYPDRPIKIFVGFAAGGGTDVAARILAQKLTETLGQSVVVENRPGASGMIA